MFKTVPIIFLSLILVLPFPALTQNKPSKSDLKQIVQSDPSDSAGVNAYIELSLEAPEQDSAFHFAYQAFKIANASSHQFSKANAHYTLGRLHIFYRTDLDSGAYYLDKAAALFDKEKYPDFLAGINIRRGHLLVNEDRHAEAMKLYLDGLKYYEKKNDVGELANLYNIIANSNNYLGYHPVALKQYDIALEYYAQLGDEMGKAVVLSNMAIIYCEEEQYEKCLDTNKKVIRIYEENGNELRAASMYTKLGGDLSDLGRYDSAEYYLSKSEEILARIDNPLEKGFNNQTFGRYYNNIGEYDQSIERHKEALEIAAELRNAQLTINNNEYIADSYEAIGDYRNALKHFRITTELSDSLFTLSSDRQINEIQARYENAKQISENERLKGEAALRNAELQKQKLYNISLAIFIFLALSASIVLFIGYRKILNQKKQAELDGRTIRNQAVKLEHNDQLKSKFFSNISHELRTPLTIMLGMIESLIKKGESHFAEEDYGRIKLAKTHGRKIQQLIDEVFELTKMEVNSMRLDVKPIQILPLMERIVFSFHSLAEERGIDLNISYGQVHNTHVDLDAAKFEKVINNLITNALKFTLDGGEVTIKINLSGDRKNVIVSVTDTGVGISKTEQEYIFDRFYQASAGIQNANPGTGLGLAMAKEITELHGGRIDVESEKGSGSTFTLMLPMSKNSEINFATSEEAIQEQPFEELIKGLRLEEIDKIMVVEDNPDMREYLDSIFCDHFRILFCSNGEEALRSLKTNRVSLIISDLMMPKMNGAELLEQLKQDPLLREIPVIILTAKLDEKDKLHALRLGVDDYLTKPFSADEILIRVKVLIKNYLSRNQWNAEEGPAAVGEEESLIVRISDYVKSNIGNYNITISNIADHVAMSERQLYRKIGALTGLTPNQLIREIKLRYAMELIQSKSIGKVSSLAKEVGFESSSYFAKLFLERFGKRPQDYISAVS